MKAPLSRLPVLVMSALHQFEQLSTPPRYNGALPSFQLANP
jgi:hypothetical protein